MTYSVVNWITIVSLLSSSYVTADGNGSTQMTTTMHTHNNTLTTSHYNGTTDMTTVTSDAALNATNYFTSTVPSNSTTANIPESSSTVFTTSAFASTNSQSTETDAVIKSQSTTTELAGTRPVETTTTEGNVENTTTTTDRLSILEQVQVIWEAVVVNVTFSDTVLNGTSIETITAAGFTDLIAEYYKRANETELQIFLESQGLDELARLLLDEGVLEDSILDEFNSSQNASIYGFLASLIWLKEDVLEEKRILQLASLYGEKLSSKTGNDTDNSTSSNEGTLYGFIDFILSKASAEEMFVALCRYIREQNLETDLCTPTTITTTTIRPLPGPEIFHSTWNTILSSTFDFLSQSQQTALQNLSPENMTTGIENYVNGLNEAQIQSLVDANITKYISSVLRSNGNAAAVLGQEVVNTFGGNEDKEDLYYLYLNFLNNLYSRKDKFENVLRGYINASSSANARMTPTCDTSSITANGLCCYTILTEGKNQTAIRDSVCNELNGGNECIASFNVNDNDEEEDPPTSSPVQTGLSTGAIIGIAVGGTIVTIIIITIILFLLWKRCNKKKSKVNPQDEEPSSDALRMESRTPTDTHTRQPTRTNGHAPSASNSVSE